MGARLGQHFLKREDIVDRIAAAVEIAPGQNVVEIGPGKGILTRRLIDTGASVTAVEYDERLYEELRERFKGTPNLRLIRSDFLEFDLAELPRPCSFAANLPYVVAAPILQRILSWPHWDKAVLMFQKEVAERIMASHGTRKYGILSVSVRLHASSRLVCDVSRECFAPRPAVESAVVRFDRKELPLPDGLSETRLMDVVKAAFGQRRKQIANSLAHGLKLPGDPVRRALESVGIAPEIRAEDISIDAFIALARVLCAG